MRHTKRTFNENNWRYSNSVRRSDGCKSLVGSSGRLLAPK